MTEIKDSVYAFVSGTVNYAADRRFTVEVKPEQSKSKYPDRVTVWEPDFTVNDGDRVTVKDWLSWTRNEKPDGKVYLNVSLNQPVFVGHQPQAQPAVDNAGWSSDTTPF